VLGRWLNARIAQAFFTRLIFVLLIALGVLMLLR
jgi:uncharacterized membrane protein YfcA